MYMLTYMCMNNDIIVCCINREIRQVPLSWQHPQDEAGRPLPLRDRRSSFVDDELRELLADGHIRGEIASWFMPDFSATPPDQLGLCVYETTTEGTPLSPIFADTPAGRSALVDYCAAEVSAFADRIARYRRLGRVAVRQGCRAQPGYGTA